MLYVATFLATCTKT